jgi:hypothetical protein
MQRKHQIQKRKEPPKPELKRFVGNYWEDPVFRFLSRQHRIAQDSRNGTEAVRLGELLQKVMQGTLPDEEYFRIMEDRRIAESALKKQKGKHGQPVISEKVQKPGVNIGELKRRIFNAQTSAENMIKAMDALPKEERIRTARSLPPFLRSKIAGYLKNRNL